MDFAGHRLGDGFGAQANMMASEAVWPAMAAAFESASGAARAAPAGRARGRRGGRGRRARQAVGRPARRPRRRASPGRRRPSCGSRTRPSRCRSCAACSTSTTPTRSPTAPTRSPARAATTRRRELYREAAEAAPGSVELGFWAGLGIAASGDIDAGAERVREAIDAGEGWRAAALAPGAGDRAVGGSRARRARDPEGVLGHRPVIRGGPGLSARPAPWHGCARRQTPRGCGPWPRWSSSISLGTSHRPETPNTT